MQTRILIAILLLSSIAGCAHKTVHAPALAANAPSDNSYMDLKPGERLRILIPLLKSGANQVVVDSEHQEGQTIVLSAANLIGYEMAYYSIEGKNDGKVRLQFAAAEITKDGKTVPEPNSPKLPFALPTTAQHIRLVYLVRQSQSDHNMAIAAAKNLYALNAFTEKLKSDPNICQEQSEIFCTWVPAGIAVRTMPLSSLP